MKIPKYVETALQRRVRAAINFSLADAVLTDYIEKNNIVVGYDDYCGGLEAYMNPRESAERIRLAIINKNKEE